MTYKPAYLDSADFDFAYYDVANPQTIAALSAFDEFMHENKFGDSEEVTFTKITKTLDSEGRITAVTETTDTSGVYIKIMKNIADTRMIEGRGESIEGQLIVYAYAMYYDLTNNGDCRIEIGDKIIRVAHGNKKYVVERLDARNTIGGAEVYRMLYLRREDED